MPPNNDGNKLNRIEELKSKLFSKTYHGKIEHRDEFTHPTRKDVPDVWENGNKAEAGSFRRDEFFMKTSLFKNFFIFSVIFFFLTIGYASYVFFVGGNTVSNDNIDISILGNNFTAGGEDLSLVIGITNRNSVALELVDLIVEYPKGVPNLETNSPLGMERMRQSLGMIPAGAEKNENIKLVLFGEQGSSRPIKVSIEYRVKGSNAIFLKSKLYEVAINSTPLNLSIEAPETISPNQDIALNIKATSNSTHTIPKILLKLDYPAGFEFKSSTPPTSLSNNIWNLGDLPPGAERNISVVGKMLDVSDGEEKVFHISSGSQAPGDKSIIEAVFSVLSHSVFIQKPFIEAKIVIDGSSGSEYAANAKSPIRGEIRWTNNLDTRMNDLEIRAKISGNAVDRSTIRADQGFYESASDTIIWDKNSKSGFGELNPGDSGVVTFTVSPLPLFSTAGDLLSNPTININVSISGKQLVSGYATENLNNSDSAVIKIISEAGLAAKALYYSGPFTNTGPIPPKAEAETSYTIVWTLSNTANNISKAAVRSSLPQWMKFAGSISPSEEDFVYNPVTREIVWNVGKISKGASITTAGRSVSFQVIFTPSLSQVGTMPVIINEAVLTGHDDFANVDVRVSRGSLRTQLVNDPQFPPTGGAVVK